MDIGLILALCAAISFAAAIVVVRKASAEAGESFTATMFTMFTGVPYFAVAITIAGDWSQFMTVSGRALVLLCGVGIIHFIGGRLLSYESYRLIGANKATPFTMTNPFYTVILGVIFLKESLTLFLVLGVLCIFVGAALITMENRSISRQGQKGSFLTDFKGILIALAGGVCWGVSPLLIKSAVAEIGSPFVGAFISYVTAVVVMAYPCLNKHRREQFKRLNFVSAVIPMTIGGLLVSTGQLFNFSALSRSPASIVNPIISTNALFIFFFSFLLNRRIELFTPKIILGIVTTIAGTFFLFQ